MEDIKFEKLKNNEKPREKLLKNGVQSLTDQELISLIIRTGNKSYSSIKISRDLINDYKTLKNLLDADVNELMQNKYLGIAKASSIVAALELSKRIIKNDSVIKKITNPSDVYEYMRSLLFSQNKEHLYLINLDHKNNIISHKLLSIGTSNQTLIEVREIFRYALKNNSHSIIIVHNHPSNDPTPSKEDIEITKKIAKAGSDIGIILLDHIIFCDKDFTSLKALNLFSSNKY